MNKITYIFGAGASKHALPITKEIPARLQNLLELLQTEDLRLDANSTIPIKTLPSLKSQLDFQKELIESLRWMQFESERHASIDTLAKKLFLKQDKRLRELKVALSIFLVLEQVRTKPDFRYDAFFASIINDLSELPKNIKILSWNYDYQFELAYSEYSGVQDIASNQIQLGINSKHDFNGSKRGIGIYKLNGTTGLFSSNNSNNQYVYTSDLKVPFDKQLMLKVTQSYATAMNDSSFLPSLSFAWEDESSEISFIDRAINEVKDTAALVIIGYSFPFFNRMVDRKIIESMTNLKRVYFQDPYSENIKERFQAIREGMRDDQLIIRKDTDQFLLPYEL